MSECEYIQVAVEGPTAFVTIDRPESRGAMSRAMWLALPRALTTAASNDGVRALVLRGTEGNFVSGADITEFEQLRADPELARDYDRGAEDTLRVLADLPVPSIAEIGGPCIGGGCLIASGCDLRIASRRARFGIPAGRLGLAYPYPALERLVAILGEATALDLALTARVIDADQAAALGLIHQATDEDALADAVGETVSRIADSAPLALRYLRLAIRRSQSSRIDAERIAALASDCYASEDYREGVNAFLEKRAPRFRGV